ncbi:unnamed protein product, partial [Candidula unifasciata]
TVGDIGVWQSVYSGVNLFYEDTNLPMFTTYVYRITVFNDIGQTISPNSTLVTTFGGLPRLSANVTAVAVDHLSIYVQLDTPRSCRTTGTSSESNSSSREQHQQHNGVPKHYTAKLCGHRSTAQHTVPGDSSGHHLWWGFHQ